MAGLIQTDRQTDRLHNDVSCRHDVVSICTDRQFVTVGIFVLFTVHLNGRHYYCPCYHLSARYIQLYSTPDTDRVSTVYSVANVLYLEFVVLVKSFPPRNMYCKLTLGYYYYYYYYYITQSCAVQIPTHYQLYTLAAQSSYTTIQTPNTTVLPPSPSRTHVKCTLYFGHGRTAAALGHKLCRVLYSVFHDFRA